MIRKNARPNPENAAPAEGEKPSRTRRKKAAEELQKTGERLLDLKDAQLEALQLPPELLQAVSEARTMNSRGARRRQMQYIGSLMRQIDAGRLQQELAKAAWQEHREARAFRLAERWRDDLLSGDPERLEALAAQFPRMDKEALRRLVEEARLPAAGRSKAGRALFRFLRPFADQLTREEP